MRVAVALVHEKLLTEREALLRIDAKKMDFFLHPIIDPNIGLFFCLILCTFICLFSAMVFVYTF